jgi:Gram-negative bacterial TonB protein C-terminal
MNTKFWLLFLSAVLALSSGHGQEKKSLLKSWIKWEAYDLANNNQKLEDTMYTRYTFLKNDVYICLTPAWNNNRQSWSLSGDQLTIGIATYTIESLTDSTLTISSPGFRRIVLEDETYFNKRAVPVIVGQLDGEPVYEADRYITPRYEKEDFRNSLLEGLEGYNNGLAVTFNASFIVKKDGTVDQVKVINSLSSGFDEVVCKQLTKTSKKWRPAVYNGQAVQTRMFYTIKYLARGTKIPFPPTH